MTKPIVDIAEIDLQPRPPGMAPTGAAAELYDARIGFNLTVERGTERARQSLDIRRTPLPTRCMWARCAPSVAATGLHRQNKQCVSTRQPIGRLNEARTHIDRALTQRRTTRPPLDSRLSPRPC